MSNNNNSNKLESLETHKILLTAIFDLAPKSIHSNIQTCYDNMMDEQLTNRDIACKLTYFLNMGVQFGIWRFTK